MFVFSSRDCSQVEEIFLEMVAKEPLLRIAISRGLTLSLEELDQGNREEEEEDGERGVGREEGERREGGSTTQPAGDSPATSSRGEGGRRREGGRERKPDAATGELLSPSLCKSCRIN